MDHNTFTIINNLCASLKKLGAFLNNDANNYEEAGSQLAAAISHARATFADNILAVLDNIDTKNDNNNFIIINSACASLKKLVDLLNDDADNYEKRDAQPAAAISHARATFADNIFAVLDSIINSIDSNNNSNRKAG